MVRKIALFSYKHGSSLLHCLDARIKLLLIFVTGYAAFSLQSVPCIVCIAAIFIISTVSGFTLREQLSQLKPTVYYAVLLYTASLICSFTEHTHYPALIVPRSADIVLFLRLTLAIQFTGLLYRTTSPLELRTALEQIEDTVGNFFHFTSSEHSTIPNFSETFSLLLVFIPQFFDVWQEIYRAWKARNGKGSIRMLQILFPVFISVCMKRAYSMSLALRNRCLQKL